jgi:lysyl-tRNA synthetase class 2
MSEEQISASHSMTQNRKGAEAEQFNHSSVEEGVSYSELLQIRRDKLADLRSRGKDPFLQTKFDATHHTTEILENFDILEGKEVSLAGRMMSKREMGKASFSDLRDRDGKIQLYIRVNDIGEDCYQEYKKLDLGDIIGVLGTVFRTKKGEISVHVRNLTLLSKSLQPLPEKWHGLKDTDLRYRQRYVDLIVNPEVARTFRIRSAVISAVRHFLDGRDFMEVETPILNTIPGGATARPFITHHNSLNMDMYLRIATELHLKRLIVGGLERVYEIGRIFRNEGMSTKHNPEFTTIELYQAYTDFRGMMEITEQMIRTVTQEVLGTSCLTYQGTEIDLGSPFQRMTMIESVHKYAGVDFNQIKTAKQAYAAAVQHRVEVTPNLGWGDILNLFFEEFVEDKLIQPTFITEYPIEVSPLAKRIADRPEMTERFELFIYGRELANAFSELNDPIDQRERFERQVALREAGDEEANMMDDDFILALEYAMPPTGGMGMGIDRLVMILTDSASIRDVLLFPTMKPLEL